MFTKLGALFSRGGPPASPTAKVSTQVDGDNVNVVNVVVQGGAAWPLPMRTTLWTETPQDLQSVAALLRWNTRLAPLLGREAELVHLRTWVESDASVSIQLLHAPGGQGKTRLAAEFASALEGWRHGWIDLGDFSQAEALTWQGRCLLLVDYPEHRPAQLEQLARAVERAAAQPGQRLRILLVAREAQAVQTAFQNRPCAAWLKPPLALTELPTDSGHALVKAALERLSVFYRRALVPVAPAAFEAWRARHPLHHNPLLATALAIDLATHAEERLSPAQWLSGPELLAKLVENETRWWEKTAAGHGAPIGALITVMAWAALSGRLTDRDINQTLAADQGWSETTLRAIHAALSAACRRAGEHGWAPMEPDLLAARFIDGWLGAADRQGRESKDAALAHVLLHTDDPGAFDFHLNRLNMLAYDQTVRLGLRPPEDGHRLERVVCTWAEAQTELLIALGLGLDQRSSWPGLSWLASAVSQRQVATLAPDATDAQRAGGLNNLAVRLRETGDWAGALTSSQEAVAIYRRLVQSNPVTYEANLAMSLNNLASYLSGTGDRAGALAPSLESVGICRRLVQANPGAYEPDLAMSLTNLATQLSVNGDRAGAQASAQEAVAIYRHLVQANPVTYEPLLAASLNNLTNRLSGVGDRAGAFALAKEAVAILRRLAHANPAAYELSLAGCLTNLAIRLIETGDRVGALALSQEAVMIYRRLAQANPTPFEPSLATNLNNLANILGETGDRVGALAHAQEAVNIYRRLARANPAAYEPNLAAGLINLTNRLSETGNKAGALAMGQEAVTIYRRLARANSAAYEPNLAGSLNNLGTILSESGDRASALRTAQEAVAIHRRLTQANPAAYEPDLAGSLNNLANRLSETEDCSEALAPAQEAVAIRRRLVEVNPAAHAPDLAMSLGALMLCQAAAGNRAAAIKAGEESFALFTALSERLPASFERYRLTTEHHLQSLRDD